MCFHQGNIPLRREGLPLVLTAAWVTLVCAILGWVLLTMVFLAATLFGLQFFRDPERIVPQEPEEIVAPADGKVVVVDRQEDPFDGQVKNRIGIFMHVFNVHVNRAPVSATVEETRYVPGSFRGAFREKAAEENERHFLHLRDVKGEAWTLVQICGGLARRILCWAEKEARLEKGERLGMIQFGSRVDLYLPQSYEIVVYSKETVLAGQSIIARFREE